MLPKLSLVRLRPLLCFVLLFLFITPPLFAQEFISVRGHVIDENGQPVSGATVSVQNSRIAVSTDAAGNFEIRVPRQRSALVVTSVGYKTRVVQGVTNDPSKIVAVILETSSTVLDQVVVVGYGTQRRKDVTGAISSIKGDDVLSVPTSNIQGAMQGKAAGVDVQTVGTTPGSTAQIRIRGIRSINGSNDPLLVVDGIPFDGSLNDLNPDDISSFEILKDASATAIYGSRGSNGVILITLKRGKPGEARVTYSGYYGIATVAKAYPVFNDKEYQAMRNISPWTQGYEPEELQYAAEGKSTDWQRLMYQHGQKTDQNITVTGGSNGSSYALGGSYYRETSVLPGQDFSRYSLRATIDSRIGNRIHFGLSMLPNVSVTHGSQFVNPMFPILALSPLEPAYDSAGGIVKAPDGDNDDKQTQYSPLLLKNNNNEWQDVVTRVRTINSLYAELEILKGLRYRANLGLNYGTEEDDQFQAADDPTGANPSYFRPGMGSMAYVNNASEWGATIENLLIYDKSFGKSHFNFTGLYSFEEFHSHNTSAEKDSITANFTQYYDLALSSPTPAPVVNGGESSWALVSYMARVNYNYDDRFLLTLTGRDDGSSRLAAGHKFHQYPAIAAGWNLLNEKFMRNTKTLSILKLRAGYGQTSNQSVSPYASLGLVSNANGIASPANVTRYNYGPEVVTGYGVVTLPNPNLNWEYTKTVNFAVDFGFLNNRITGSFDWYHAHTDKILYSVSLPATSGVAGPYTTNVGQMSNTGPELEVTSENIIPHRGNGFSWTTELNLFWNRNKLLALSSGVDQDIANQLFVGYSMTSIFDYKKLGIWQQNQAAQAAEYGSVPGQIRLEHFPDYPGGKADSAVTSNDRVILGNQDAKIQGGMTNRFTYHNWDFTFVLYGRFGGMLVSQVHQPFADYLTVMDGKRNGIKVDYWTPTNPTNWFPEPSATTSPVGTAWTTLGYYSGSFLQLRSLNLGYTLTPNVVRKLGGQAIHFYVVVDNVGYFFSPFLKQTGVNPVATNEGSAGVSSPGNIRPNTYGNGALTVNSSTPQNRTYSIGANITF